MRKTESIIAPESLKKKNLLQYISVTVNRDVKTKMSNAHVYNNKYQLSMTFQFPNHSLIVKSEDLG